LVLSPSKFKLKTKIPRKFFDPIEEGKIDTKRIFFETLNKIQLKSLIRFPVKYFLSKMMKKVENIAPDLEKNKQERNDEKVKKRNEEIQVKTQNDFQKIATIEKESKRSQSTDREETGKENDSGPKNWQKRTRTRSECSPAKQVKPSRPELNTMMPEILIKIFNYISTRDLLKNVALVSKRFKALTEDFEVRLTVTIYFNTRLRSVLDILQRSIQIRKLRILTDQVTASVILIAASLKYMINLEEVETDSLFLTEIFKIPSLKILTANMTRAKFDKIGLCQGLVVLNINKALTSTEFNELSNLVHLKSLNIRLSHMVRPYQLQYVFYPMRKLIFLTLYTPFMRERILSDILLANPLLKKLTITLTRDMRKSLLTGMEVNHCIRGHQNLEEFKLYREDDMADFVFDQDDFQNFELFITKFHVRLRKIIN